MYIGRMIHKPIEDLEKYSTLAAWCNDTQKGYIEDKGDYYEVVAIPEPSAEEVSAQELAQAKVERAEAVSKITVEVDGMVFDGDETSQHRMSRSIVALTVGETIPWVLHDNTIATVTRDQLKQALRLACDAQTALWTKPYEGKE